MVIVISYDISTEEPRVHHENPFQRSVGDRLQFQISFELKSFYRYIHDELKPHRLLKYKYSQLGRYSPEPILSSSSLFTLAFRR